MSEKIVNIQQAREEKKKDGEGRVNAQLVALLEHLLARAKSGDLVGFAGATVAKDGTASQGYSGVEHNVYGLIAATEAVKHQLLNLLEVKG